MRIRPGSEVTFPGNNVQKAGNVLSAAPGRDDAIDSAEKAARSILIRLEAPNAETDAFLLGNTQSNTEKKFTFPPDAFALDERLSTLLSALPEGITDGITGGITGSGLAIVPFPEFTESGLKDHVGRSVQDSLNAVRTLTGMDLPVSGGGKNTSLLGRPFWQALIRGGYQGAVYYIDSLVGYRGVRE